MQQDGSIPCRCGVDALLQVGTNICVQNISGLVLPFYGPKHDLCRFAHNIVITFLLTESHSGYDAPWSLHNLFPGGRRVYGGAWAHEKHHSRGDVHFQQFFCYLDWLGGTASWS